MTVCGGNWHPVSTVIYVGGTYARLCAYAPYNSVEFKNSSLKTEAGLTMQTYAVEKDMRFAVSGEMKSGKRLLLQILN